MAQGDHIIAITFVINGENYPENTNVNAPLHSVVAKALADSHNTGRSPSDWEVRDTNGVLLEVGRKVKDLGLVDGARLFLSLGIGAGGGSATACK